MDDEACIFISNLPVLVGVHQLLASQMVQKSPAESHARSASDGTAANNGVGGGCGGASGGSGGSTGGAGAGNTPPATSRQVAQAILDFLPTAAAAYLSYCGTLPVARARLNTLLKQRASRVLPRNRGAFLHVGGDLLLLCRPASSPGVGVYLFHFFQFFPNFFLLLFSKLCMLGLIPADWTSRSCW
jgi:hypothetical protein